MAWSCGIVGLPNAGKSTLFKALTAQNVVIESYPFSTIDPNLAVVPLADRRLQLLAEKCGSSIVTPATLRVVDVAGLVQGASRGEGLGNRFLGQLRAMDLLVHVVADFRQECGEPPTDADPASAAAVVNLELCLADLEVLERRRDKVAAGVKSGDKQAAAEAALLERLMDCLNAGRPLRRLDLQFDEKKVLDQLSLLTAKKMIYVVNQAEGVSADRLPRTLLEAAEEEGCPVIGLCARLEAELSELPPGDREQFAAGYGLGEPGVQRLLAECRRLMELVTFYTVKGGEARAWMVPSGTTALEAAEKVHTDIARGFINVEVIPWKQLLEAGGVPASRERGYARTEGRDYRVTDGDVLQFRFRG